MKKQTALALAAVFSLSVAGTALAAPANPFVDVPAKHWAYDSVNTLAKSGVISGYGDGTYKGDKTLTRYEIAVIVGKAMANSDKMDPETKKALEALKAEFGAELANLGVRVDTVEKKIGNVKFSGNARVRLNDDDVLGTETQDLKLRTRLGFTGQINEEWAYNGRFENVQDLKHGGNDAATSINIANVSGKIGDVAVTLGRFDVMPAYGFILDDTVDGAVASFGDKLKVDLYVGRTNYTVDTDDVYIANLGYAISDKLNAKGAYFHVKPDAGDKINVYEIGMDYQLSPDYKIAGAFVKSDLDTQNKAAFGQIAYKGADTKTVGSYGAFLNYHEVQANSVILSTTFDFITAGNDGKGFELGFTYVPMKNSKWTTVYADIEGKVNSSDKRKSFQSQMEFFF